MLNDVLILLVSLVIILFAAELFTNGIEWMGRKLGLGEGAVGSVLAAVGTALPETLIPIIAIVFATAEGAH
jgi:cation:H+ antiporter